MTRPAERLLLMLLLPSNLPLTVSIKFYGVLTGVCKLRLSNYWGLSCLANIKGPGQ